MTGALAARVNAVKQRIAGRNNPHRVLVPLLDPTTELEERVAPILRRTGMDHPSRDELVEALIESADPWLKACGLAAVDALGLRALAGAVEASLDSEDELVRETARAARRRLAQAT